MESESYGNTLKRIFDIHCKEVITEEQIRRLLDAFYRRIYGK